MAWGRRPPAVKMAMRFLEVALSKAGPMSLCYVPENKWIIREHIIDVVQDHPTLSSMADPFTYDDGSTAYLLKVFGVLPLKKLAQSAFPAEVEVVIWLHRSYPVEPPSVIVSLPQAAAQAPLRLNHPFVDPTSGAVTTPYLVRWSDPNSGSSSPNLSQLVHNLIKIFTCWPPFAFTIPPPAAAPIPEAPLQDTDAVPNTAAGAQQANNRTPRNLRPSTSMASPREAADRLAMTLLYGFSLFTAEVQHDMAGLDAVKAKLKDRAAAYYLIDSISADDLGQIQKDVDRVNARVDDLEKWLKKMDKSQFPEHAPEDFYTPGESNRKLEEHSCMTAIDDLIDRLDKLVETKLLPFESYLKQVRGLAREKAAYIHREAVNVLFPHGLPQSGSAHRQARP